MLSCESCGDQLTVAAGKRPVCFCDHFLCETCVDESGVCPLCNLRTDLIGDERVCEPLLKGVKKSVGSASKAVKYPCDNHGESEVKFFCYEHKAVLCADCAWEHRDHQSIKKYGTNDVQADLLLVWEVLDNHMNQCQELRKSATEAFARGELFASMEKYHMMLGKIAENKALAFAPPEECVSNDIGSTILHRSEADRVLKMFGATNPPLQLLYRASRDGDSSAQFHAKCDGKWPTLVVVHARGKKFGGFTISNWSYQNGYTVFAPGDRRNFFFHLNPDFAIHGVDGKNHGIQSDLSCGPVFGNAGLVISSGCLSNTNSCCTVSKEYVPINQNQFNCINDLGKFQVTDYEVFLVLLDR